MRSPLPCLLLLAAAATFARAAESRLPNIIVILADDLGWRDLAVGGHEWHETPHLDRLAAQGMRFTQAYASAPICSASRAALLTGRSPARLHFEFVTKLPTAPAPAPQPLLPPPYPLDLPLSELTLGELATTAGYRTGYFGKWHLSRHHGGYLGWSTTHGPLQQGFGEGDQEFGSHSYGDPLRPAAEQGPLRDGDYGDDQLTNRAIEFIRRHRDRPFFLFLGHYHVHTPIRTRAVWLEERYRERLPRGADPRRAAYAAMVETLDHEVGRLLHALDALGLAEDTLVVFTSDNGGHPSFSTNAPARGSKWNLYEGGLRVPLFVRWPGRVAAGGKSDVPVVGADLYPTLAAVMAQPLPADIRIDGINLLPLCFDQTATLPARALVWHFPYYHPESAEDFRAARAAIGWDDFHVTRTRPHSALRLGTEKLLHFYEDDRNEFYDLANDPGERHNLAAERPARAQQLRQRLEAELRAVDARFPVRR